jgi:cholesterol transport system auxiliary component
MRLLARTLSVVALASLGACSLSGLLGGGNAKGPAYFATLTSEAPDPGPSARTANAGQSVTIEAPTLPKELRTVRVPVQVNPTAIEYLTGIQWVDTPDRLFQELVAETVRRTTNRVVFHPAQVGLDPGLALQGQLQRFGYDAQTVQVVVVFDGTLLAPGAAQVETRRFTATAPADGTAATVGPALNRAANEVATQVAQWIGSSAG